MIAFLIFTLCRVGFTLYNLDYFEEVSPLLFFYGLRFDLATIAWLFSPYILLEILPIPFKSTHLYQLITKIVFHFSNFVCIGFNVMDFEYFTFTFKRTTTDLFNQFAVGNDFFHQVPEFFITYWYLSLLIIALVLISIWLFNKTIPDTKTCLPEGLEYEHNFTFKNFLIQLFIAISVVAITIIASRGGTQLKPIGIIDAGTYTSPSNIPIVLNTPFTLMKTVGKTGLSRKNYFIEDQLSLYFSPIQQLKNDSSFIADNVIVFILESFSLEYFGLDNPQKTYTPFLDSLISEGLLFNNCYANGKKSIEGIPSIISSMPSLMNNPYISSNYAGNNLNSLASILKKKGYYTSFFHGGHNGTMGFEPFAKSAGFDKYHGMDEYNNETDYDGNWGIYDEPFFLYFYQELATHNQPFFSCMMSLSSHHPYSIPVKHQQKFPEEGFKILKTIRYTDYALQLFFEKAKNTSWFKNTLFIFTADHTAPISMSFTKGINGLYKVPLLFYHPNKNLKGINTKLSQQTDILPSTLDLLNYPDSFVAFGQSVFKDKYPGYSISFLNDIYQLITKKYVIHFNGVEITGYYDRLNDPLLKSNLLIKSELNPNYLPSEIVILEQQLKSIIQSYNKRLLNNQLSIQ